MSFAAIGQIVETSLHANPLKAGGARGAITSSARGLPSAERTAAALARMEPPEADAALASRLRSLGVKCGERWKDGPKIKNLMTDLNCPQRAVSLRLHPDVDLGEAREAALIETAKFSTPAPQRPIEAWLAELSVLVTRRGEDEFAEDLRVEAYASRLKAYPADVARHVLLDCRWRFWPSWAEIAEAADALAAWRFDVAQLLHHATEADRVPPHPETPAIDPDMPRRVIAEVMGAAA